MASNDPIRVAIVAYEGVSLLVLSGPLEALRIASTHPNISGRPSFTRARCSRSKAVLS